MSRSFGWHLPPGVTDRQIDETVQGDEPPAEPEELLAEAVRQLAAAKVEVADLRADLRAGMPREILERMIDDFIAGKVPETADEISASRRTIIFELIAARRAEIAEAEAREADYVRHVAKMAIELSDKDRRIGDLADSLGHSRQVEHALRVELARRNTQCAALLDIAEAAKELLAAVDTDLGGPKSGRRGRAAADRLRAALAATADVPKAEP